MTLTEAELKAQAEAQIKADADAKIKEDAENAKIKAETAKKEDDVSIEDKKKHDEIGYHQRKLDALKGKDETSVIKDEILKETASKTDLDALKAELKAEKQEKYLLKAMTKFNLDESDATFITATDEEVIFKQAEALRKKYDSIIEKNPGKQESKTITDRELKLQDDYSKAVTKEDKLKVAVARAGIDITKLNL